VSKSALPFEKGVEMKERGEGMTLVHVAMDRGHRRRIAGDDYGDVAR
jgi:hypothetical protein